MNTGTSPVLLAKHSIERKKSKIEMAKQACDECEEEEMRPSFYRIIHPLFNTTQYLRIPSDFVKHIADGKMVVLESPGGEHWNVEVCKTADAMYLQDGWPNFVKVHSLGNYEFLVFRYDGKMLLNVRIFDQTGCERQESPEPVIIPVKPRKSIETCYKTMVRPRKQLVIHCPWRRRGGRPRKSKPCPTNAAALETTSSRAANSFTSEFPHFISSMSVHNLRSSNMLSVPSAFAYAHLPKRKTEVVVMNQQGEAWIFNFIPRHHAFCGGWARFVRDNQLKEGDICVFELVGDQKMSVHFFPIS